MQQGFVRRFVNFFIRGLLFLAPVYFTGTILYQVFLFLDGIIPIGIGSGDERIRLWGVGLVLVLGIVVGVGFLGSTFLAVPVFRVFEDFMNRLPLVRIIYSSIKDLTDAFVGDKKKFNQPVLVKMDESLSRLGFLTQEDLIDLGLPEKVAVYLPQSYAFAGDLFIVPRENITLLDINAAEVMKLIVSGGVSRT